MYEDDLFTVDPSAVTGDLNNLSGYTGDPITNSQIVASYGDDPMAGYSYDIGGGLIPANYDFSTGIDGNIDGMAYQPVAISTNAPQGFSTKNNPGATPNSFFPGGLQGIFQSLLSYPAPKPVPMLAPGSVGVGLRRTPGLFQQQVGGGVSVGQLAIAGLVALCLVAVARS